MTPDRFVRLQEAFHRASDAPPGERERVLDEVCAGDGELRAQTVAMLGALESTSAFAEPRLAIPVDVEDMLRKVAGSRAEADPTVIGTRLGKYTIRSLIGEGGFGTVYRATQEAPARDVALKVLRCWLSSPASVARFRYESEVLGLMDHPNIARIFEADIAPDNTPYLAMEYVRGDRITTYCNQRRVPLRERLELFIIVCEAVQHAHIKGVIHRDLKPGNILVEEIDGRPVVKVIDFGIAKAIGGAGEAHPEKTLTGQSPGTPAYMSPEQAAGSRDLDVRADVYGLGAILYELVSGVPAFDFGNTNLIEAAERVRTGSFVPLRKHQSRVDPDLACVVDTAMATDRGGRYRSAESLAQDVRSCVECRPIEARRGTSIGRAWKYVRRNPALSGASAIAAASTITLLAIFLRSLAERAKHGDEVKGVGEGLARLADKRTIEDQPLSAAPSLALEKRVDGSQRARLRLEDVTTDDAGVWSESTWRVRLTSEEAAEYGASVIEVRDNYMSRLSDIGKQVDDVTGARWGVPGTVWDPPLGSQMFTAGFAMLADIDPRVPGRELIVCHRPQTDTFPLGRISVLHVFDLRLEPLHELWTWGMVTGAAWDAKAGHLVVSLHCGKLMDCDAELAAYDRLYCGRMSVDVPMIAAIRGEHLRGVLFPYRLDVQPAKVEWALVRRPIDLRDPASAWIIYKLSVARSPGDQDAGPPQLIADVRTNTPEGDEPFREFQTRALLGPEGTLRVPFGHAPNGETSVAPLLDDQLMRVDLASLVAGRAIADPLLKEVGDLDAALDRLEDDTALSSDVRAAARSAATAMWTNWRWLHISAGDLVESGRSLSEAEKQRALRWAERSVELHDARCPRRDVCEAEWYVHSVFGAAQFQSEQYAEALATFSVCERMAKQRSPGGASGDAAGIAYQALCLHRLGRDTEARAALHRAIQDLEKSSNNSGETKRILDEAKRLLGESVPDQPRP